MAKNIEDYDEIIKSTENETIKKYAQAGKDLESTKEALPEGGLYNALTTLQKVISAGGTGSVNEEEVQRIVDEELKTTKISVSNLDSTILDMLNSTVTLNVNLTQPSGASRIIKAGAKKKETDRPLFQALISDLLANNNSYVYGAAGTGKSFMAGVIARTLGWQKFELNCNQFTSPTEIIGGQTIEGYQKGELEMAWTNQDQAGNKFDGAIILLDELPKLDPNTAGVLNAALASKSEVGLLGVDKVTGEEIRPTLKNGRGEKLPLGNLFIYATGNAPLNEADPDYEANFKQDLSLQDRFVGSMYKVYADYGFEASELDGCLFIFNGIIPLREAILKGDDGQSFAGKGFVSLRILLSMKRTFLEYLKIKNDPNSLVTKPKNLKLTLDSFLEIFTDKQRETLKAAMNYDEFVKIAKAKESKTYKFAADGNPVLTDTEEEINKSKQLIEAYNKTIKAIYVTDE